MLAEDDYEPEDGGPPLYRWHAKVIYRTDDGPLDVEHTLEELEDLHDLIEAGPHWDTIKRIEIIRINHSQSDKLTVEVARDI